MSDVPCNGCNACCHRQGVLIMPEDMPNLAHYDTREVSMGTTTALILKLKDDHSCVHLTPEGCGIYEHRPWICRTYDCRKQFLSMTRNERRSHSCLGVWEAARQRLNTLDDADKADIERYRVSTRARTNHLRHPIHPEKP